MLGGIYTSAVTTNKKNLFARARAHTPDPPKEACLALMNRMEACRIRTCWQMQQMC